MKGNVFSAFWVLLSMVPLASSAQEKIINATVLMSRKEAPDPTLLVNTLKNQWKVPVDSLKITDRTLVFNSFGGSTVMVAYLDYPAAADEVGAAARLSWLWKDGAGMATTHQAQVIVSVIGPSIKTLDLYRIMTQTTAAVIEVTKAPAIFQQAQYLLLESGYFTSAARNMVANQSIPAYCWIYFGRPGGGNGFTYGLAEFGLPEMEIAQSSYTESEVHATLYDAVMTRIKYPSTISDGQIFMTEEGARLVVRIRTSSFLDNQLVLSLEY